MNLNETEPAQFAKLPFIAIAFNPAIIIQNPSRADKWRLTSNKRSVTDKEAISQIGALICYILQLRHTQQY